MPSIRTLLVASAAALTVLAFAAADGRAQLNTGSGPPGPGGQAGRAGSSYGSPSGAGMSGNRDQNLGDANVGRSGTGGSGGIRSGTMGEQRPASGDSTGIGAPPTTGPTGPLGPSGPAGSGSR